MNEQRYKLRYLPAFYEDLEQRIDYITEILKNTTAANKLLDDVEQAILARLPVAESFEQYHSKKDRKYPYYRIYVGNFVIYYVVIADEEPEKIMEVRRLLYKKQNRTEII